MVKDARGNELKVGDHISLEIPSTRVVLVIQDIQEGGIITGTRSGGAEARPGMIVLSGRFSTQFDPTMPIIGNMLKLHTEEQDAETKKNLVTMH